MVERKNWDGMKISEINLTMLYPEQLQNYRCYLNIVFLFVKKGGYFVSYKSRRLDEEIENADNALNMLYTKYEKKYKYELEYDHSERYLVFFRCENITDSKYPRKPKKIKTNPL